MIKLHQLAGYIQTIFLAEYEDKLLLLDGCCRADVTMIKQFITQELKRPLSDLTMVVVTHFHPDHAGAAAKLRRDTQCLVVGANVSGHWYAGIKGRLMHISDLIATRWVAKKKNKPVKNIWYAPQLKLDMHLDDQSLLPGFEDWQVIFTQGHTDRDISLLHKPSHKIYVADLFVKVRGNFIPPLPVFYPRRYVKSLKKIADLAPTSIYLAHDGEVEVSGADFEQLIERAPVKPVAPWTSIVNKFAKFFQR